MNNVAGIAVALKEALSDDYVRYAKAVVENAKHLAKCMIDRGFELVTGGTDSHMIVADVTKGKDSVRAANGIVMSEDSARAGIVFNKNAVPGDEKPWRPSGIRIGTPASTTVGMGVADMEQIADWLVRIAQSKSDGSTLDAIRREVGEAMTGFRVP